MDARSGDIVAYVGSACYTCKDLASPQFDPQFDVAGRGYRQPGSAWKPLVYMTGFDNHTITPGSLLVDVVTEFTRGWFPRDADLKERGPVLMRDGLGYSLNIPTIKALDRIGVDNVAELARRLGITFIRGDNQLESAGLAGAIGNVETNMVQLTSAFATIANAGVQNQPRTILEILDANGQVVPTSPAPPQQQMSPQATWLMSDILKDSTDPAVNTIFGPRLEIVNGIDGSARPRQRPPPGSGQDGHDQRPARPVGVRLPRATIRSEPAAHRRVGVDGQLRPQPATRRRRIDRCRRRPRPRLVVFPARALARLARGPVPAHRPRASSLRRSTPGPAARPVRGRATRGPNTSSTARSPAHRAPSTSQEACIDRAADAGSSTSRKQRRAQPQRWLEADLDWMDRARRGVGLRGPNGGRTAHLFGRFDWGGFIAPIDCTYVAHSNAASERDACAQHRTGWCLARAGRQPGFYAAAVSFALGCGLQSCHWPVSRLIEPARAPSERRRRRFRDHGRNRL